MLVGPRKTPGCQKDISDGKTTAPGEKRPGDSPSCHDRTHAFKHMRWRQQM